MLKSKTFSEQFYSSVPDIILGTIFRFIYRVQLVPH